MTVSLECQQAVFKTFLWPNISKCQKNIIVHIEIKQAILLDRHEN